MIIFFLTLMALCECICRSNFSALAGAFPLSLSIQLLPNLPESLFGSVKQHFCFNSIYTFGLLDASTKKVSRFRIAFTGVMRRA